MKSVLAMLLAAAALPAAAEVAVCGGVGSDERFAMESAARSSNLAVEMFVAQGGEYLADVHVTVRRENAREDTLAVRAQGPLCYLKLEPGRYRIEATFQGITRSAQATVPRDAKRPVRVAIAFPKSVGDQQTDAASPEEKAQAAKRP